MHTNGCLLFFVTSARTLAMENTLARQSPTVFVVDGDSEVRNSLKFLLEIEGFVVHLYADAQALLNDAGLPRDGCLVVDYDLPGLDGLAALEQLRRRGVLMPAILITGYPNSAVRRRSSTIETLVIEKPLLGTALIDALRGIFGTPLASTA